MFFSKNRKPVPLPVQDRRRSVRHATVLQVAKIRFAGGREELCLLRDVSPDGLRVEIYVEVGLGDSIEIELRTGHTIGGKVAWVEDNHVGMAFDQMVPMSAMLAHCSFDDRLGKLRPPRLVVDIYGMLRVDFEERVVRIGNISQAGIQLAAAVPLDAGAPCVIVLPGLVPRSATVRWSRGPDAGLMLTEPFEYCEFAAWRAVLGGATRHDPD